MERVRSDVGDVTVLYFAAARERAGVTREVLPLAGLSVAVALDRICAAHPDLLPIRDRLRVALDQAFVPSDATIPPESELAVIPPVAGGDGTSATECRVTLRETPLSIDEALEAVAHPGAGAQVVMIGVVRDHNEGEPVEGLCYEAYPAMAERVIADIVGEVEREFPTCRCAVQHRTGTLDIGDRAVVVAVSAPHRHEAFEACRRVIDRLKEDAPIWKHEHRAQGRVWVGLGP